MNQNTPDRIKCSSDNAIQAAGNAILYGGVIIISAVMLQFFNRKIIN